jgi:hypothetical protein
MIGDGISNMDSKLNIPKMVIGFDNKKLAFFQINSLSGFQQLSRIYILNPMNICPSFRDFQNKYVTRHTHRTTTTELIDSLF